MILKVILWVIGAAVLSVCAINVGMIFGESRRILSESEAALLGDVDCIMVLGCGVRPDGTPSPMLNDRLTVAMRVYDSGVSDRLLMSGDHGKAEYDEVNTMKRFAVDGGADPDVVFLDHAGFSTYESAYRADYIFNADKVIIVTQKYHLYRAIYDARRMGIDAYGVASDERSYAAQPYYSAREFAARVKDFIYCIFKPKPTALGDSIDLSGSAGQTDG